MGWPPSFVRPCHALVPSAAEAGVGRVPARSPRPARSQAYAGPGMPGAILWRSRVAPARSGIARALRGATHPFLPGNAALGFGPVDGGIGPGGARHAVVRMRHDDVALPPDPGEVSAS